ncbi:hypothetical protein ACFL40_05140 [candidate division KSB1 bacterium]
MKSTKIISRRGFLKSASAGIGVGTAGLFSCSGKGDVSPGNMTYFSFEEIKANTPEKLLRNAKIVLEASCRARQGETLLIIADDKILSIAPALGLAALELGLIPAVMDIRHYLSSEPYKNGYVLESLKEAMHSSDIVIENLADTWVPNRPSYGRLSGDPDMQDKALSGERRWMILQHKGLADWDVSAEDISVVPKRTKWLLNFLKNAEKGHITSAAGTDFTFGLGKGKAFLVPVLGIIPFYGEVAVMPVMSSTSGIFVIDGPTQLDVRPSSELEHEPLKVTVEKGRAVDVSGGKVQLKRMKDYIASGNPPADAIDEVGILTTTLTENDKYYWSDGTHQHDHVHIALGNNVRRDVVVHGPKHMDGEVCKPTISIDGLVIMKNGIFQDSAMQEA